MSWTKHHGKKEYLQRRYGNHAAYCSPICPNCRHELSAIIMPPTSAQRSNLFADLEARGLNGGYDQFVMQLEPVLQDMSKRGMPVSRAAFDEAKAKLEQAQSEAWAAIQALVPDDVRACNPKQGYKKEPKGAVLGEKTEHGGEPAVWGKRWFQYGPPTLPDIAREERWVKLLEWAPSHDGLVRYMQYRKHEVPRDWKTGKAITTEQEIERLARKTGDFLYAAVKSYKNVQTLLSNHMKNWEPGPDERVHPTFMYDTGTGQLSSRRPNAQNAPKHGEGDKKDLANMFRGMIQAKPGHVLIECVSPFTRILMKDLTWKVAGELKEGDELWGFDEHVANGRTDRRRVKSCQVTNISRLRKPCMELYTDKGMVTCSLDHSWLRRYAGKQRWVHAGALRTGDRLAHFVLPWCKDTSWEAGWLAGILDGEGYTNRSLGFGQNEGIVTESAIPLFRQKGFNFEPYGRRRCKQFNLRNEEAFAWMRCIGVLRPKRLLAKAISNIEGMAYWGKSSSCANVLNVRLVGEQEVVAIETTSHTFCAEGLVSHNCDYKSFHAQTLAFEAQDAEYLRLAKLDIHSYLTAHLVRHPDRDRLLTLPDEDLREALGRIKKQHQFVRDYKAKRAILGYGFGMGWRKLYMMNREAFDTQADAKRTLDTLDGIFPKACAWRSEIRLKAHEQGYLLSRFGCVRWFWEVMKWNGSGWEPGGDDSESAVAFLPANDAFCHIKKAMLNLNRAGLLAQFGLINQIHDALMFECPLELGEECIKNVKMVMEARSDVLVDPIVAPNGLSVEVGVSRGLSWDKMSEVKV